MKRELTNQELLDRYVHAVKLLLPPGKMDDLGAEIRSNLQSRVEDEETQLGRELTLAEMSAILKQHGHPMEVASRYREKPSWGFSPEVFRIYWFALRALFSAWLTIRVIVAIFTFQGNTPTGTILLNLGRDILLAALILTTGVTAVFAVWEYMEFKFRFFEKWKPESLAPVAPVIRPPAQHVPRRPATQMIGHIALLLFFAAALFSPSLFWVWGGRGVFSLSATASAMRLPLWLLAVCITCEPWLRYTRFAAAEWRQFLRLIVSIAGVALLVFLVRSGNFLVAGPNWVADQAKPLATLNQGLAGIFVLAAAAWGLRCLYELRRIIRGSGAGHQTANSAL